MDTSGEGPSSSKEEEFLPGYPTLDSYTQDFLRSMAGAIKASNSLPSDRKEDWDYYTTFKSFRDVAHAQQEAIEKQISAVLKYNGIKGRVDGNDVTRTLEILADANDQILERVGTYIDEASGVRNKIDPLLMEVSQKSGIISGSWNKQPDKIGNDSKVSNEIGGAAKADQVRLLAAKNVARPQVNFKDKIDNSLNPFMPRLTEKPHSLKPLSILVEYDNEGNECYSHPYAYEIDNFRMPEWQMEKRDETEPKLSSLSLTDTPCIMVNTLEGLNSMIAELSKFKEIGVDLEAHSYRTYLGLTCLIQISSSEKDYLVDPFPLWNDLTVLNEVFANPNILKIMHGAIGDIGWLQRDFSVYVVNMFDTHIAAKILEFPRGCLSLAFLLHHYCKVSTEKRFQLADWRIRPLIPEMIDYARSDTHHLMDIYHCMKEELLDRGNEHKNLLQAVYTQSNALCKTQFTKPRISHIPHLQKCKAVFNSRQSFAFKEIYLWRNKLARTEDESENYVMPTHMLIKISTELPREMQGILACCNPIPPLVKQYLHDVHAIILRAREQPITSLSIDGTTTTDRAGNSQVDCNATITLTRVQFDIVEDPLKCPLDLGHLHTDVFQGDIGLKVLLDDHDIRTKLLSVQFKPVPGIDLFEVKPDFSSQIKLKTFLTPFRRFQMLRPYLTALNEETSENSGKSKNDEERIRSIKEHFDALTAMTPNDFTGGVANSAEAEKGKSDNQMEVAQEEDDDDEDEGRLDHYDPNPGEVKDWRQDLASNRKKNNRKRQQQTDGKGRKSKDEGHETFSKKSKKGDEEEEVDFSKVDYSQYSGGAKKGASKNGKEFNPWKDFEKKKNNSNKQKQRYKPQAGKSVTYKK